MYTIWYSTEDFADYIISNTILQEKSIEKKKIFESDANNSKNFHTVPDHIKKILYLDAPDLIIEYNSEPILSIEVSTEAGTGHNAFQRFARLAASVENGVPAFYIYPEAVVIERQNTPPKWDKINPLVFKALDAVMDIYRIPALLYYFPSNFKTDPSLSRGSSIDNKGLLYDQENRSCPSREDNEMIEMFDAIDLIVGAIEKLGVIKGRDGLLGKLKVRNRKSFMDSEFASKGGTDNMSPLSATTLVKTEYLLNYLSQHENKSYQIGDLIKNRKYSVVYQVNAKFRGDPYPGALAAIDYLKCRQGKTFEDREHNLILVWGNFTVDEENKTIIIKDEKGSTINDFVDNVKSSENKNLLTKNYNELDNFEIPRYYMQVRYGSMFSKVKHIRVFSYFADAILFPNGSFWRDA